MGRSKRDDMKRKIAQSVNHMAQSILDINDVYLEFLAAANTLEDNLKNGLTTEDAVKDSTHRKYANYLHDLMLSISLDRDAALSFAMASWGLGEEDLLKFM